MLVAGEAGIGKTRLATEIASRACAGGFEILLGRSIDLVGTELPYQPLVEALHPLGELRLVDAGTACSQLEVFEATLALLARRASLVPVLLVLEDLHWADTSTLDLVVFLAHNLDDRRVVLLVTCRADEPSSADRMHRLAEGLRRSGTTLVVELRPLEADAMAALLASRAAAPLSPSLTEEIVARSEGNPLFAEELVAAAGDVHGALPTGLRDLLLGVWRARPPDTKPAASGRGRRTRRRLSVAAGDRTAARARRSRVTSPCGRPRHPRSGSDRR